MIESKNTWRLHPILFAAWPLLFLYSHNAGIMDFGQVGPWILLSVAMAGSLSFVLGRWRHPNAMAAGVSLTVLLFFSYGQLFRTCSKEDGWALLLTAVLFAGGIGLLIRFRERLDGLTRWLNALAMILVAVTGFEIGRRWAARFQEAAPPLAAALDGVAFPEAPSELPNIYYVILDAYSRTDILREMFGFDNQAFIDYLNSKGFVVNEEARSNYGQSILSLSSSLNMMHLHETAERLGIESQDHGPLSEILRENAVFHFLQHYGYRTISFDAAGWHVVNIPNTDVYYKTPVKGVDAQRSAVLHSTLIGAYMRLHDSGEESEHERHRAMVRYAFDKLKQVPDEKGPFIAYCHIIAPHQPFMFGPDGEPVNDDQSFSIWQGMHPDFYKPNYLGQLQYVSKTMHGVLDTITKKDPNAIIILQADHGSGLQLDTRSALRTNLRERLSILSAIRYPGQPGFTPPTTPVNTFRKIFNTQFETDFEMQPNDSFFSTWNRPYTFVPYMIKKD